jgi:hypothetical protein
MVEEEEGNGTKDHKIKDTVKEINGAHIKRILLTFEGITNSFVRSLTPSAIG